MSHASSLSQLVAALAACNIALPYLLFAEAASIDEALEATRKTDFDLAILDAEHAVGRPLYSVGPTIAA